MKKYESVNDLYGSYITGLTYSFSIAFLSLLFCFAFNELLLENLVTYILIVAGCLAFFISGLRRVKTNNVGFLMKLGRRDFSQTFSEGIWWVFPLHSFKQQPHFDKLNESEEINISFITTDQIPLDVHVKYYWRVKNLKVLDFNFNPSFIKDTLNYEFGNFIKNRPAIELLADQEISKKVMVNYLEKAGENIGISISNVFPIINYENQYLPVIRKYQEKYKELKFQIEELLMHQFVKNCDIKIYQDMILKCTEDLDLSSFEAMNFMKVYKNQINLNENTYNFPELLKIIEAVLLTLNKKRG